MGRLLKKFHPAVWLFSWAAYALLSQQLGMTILLLVALPVIAVALRLAPGESMRLLRRSSFLLMTIFLMFTFATPGERLPGVIGTMGVTFDGLWQAARHVMLLMLLLLSLATLLHTLGRQRLVAGLHVLLRPAGICRDPLLVRLVLALETIEDSTKIGSWKDWLDVKSKLERQSLQLEVLPINMRDVMLVMLVIISAMGVLLI